MEKYSCEHSCSCHHHHEESSKKLVIRLISGTLLFLLGVYFKSLPIYILSYIILGYDVILNAVKSVKNIFNESFLMSIATIGAFIIGEYPEAVAVMLFYQTGELLSHKASKKSKKSIEALMDLRAEYTRVLRNGSFITEAPEHINIGETILVSAGERVPLDGVITKGSAYFDTAAITGEAKAVHLESGDKVISGTINTDSVVEIEVTHTLAESTASKILELIKTDNKSAHEKFITKFSKVYTPIVVILACLIAILPPLFWGNISHWVYTALLFLVVSCPCAMVVSVPLTFFAGIGGAARRGVLVKGGYALEKLAHTGIIAFDKTGTLTEGEFQVQSIRTNTIKAEVLEYAAYAEYYSGHPIATAVVKAYEKAIDTARISNYKEITGYGVSATVDGKQILVGSSRLMKKSGITLHDFGDVSIYIASEGILIGGMKVEEAVKENAEAVVYGLRQAGISSVMLTGDSEKNAVPVAEMLNIPLYSELLPQDKASVLEALQKKGVTAFVGDGINDAPVLSLADTGISMGELGSDAAIEASDVVIMSDDLSKIPVAIRIAKKTLRIAKENIWLALLIKIGFMLFGVFGIAGMWMSVFADVGVCLLAVLNSLRAFRD